MKIISPMPCLVAVVGTGCTMLPAAAPPAMAGARGGIVPRPI